MKNSPESKNSHITKAATAGLFGVTALVGVGAVASPAEAATDRAEYVSPSEKLILTAGEKLDAIIASSDTDTTEKLSGGRVKTEATWGKITITKIDGKYVDSYTASEMLANGTEVFETILVDSTPNDSAYFFVLGQKSEKGKITKVFTYNNGSYSESEAQTAVKDIISL